MNAPGKELPAAGGGNPLADWCRALEERLEAALREKDELAAENERLSERARELSTILKSLEEAYVLGQLRARQRLPAAPGGGAGPATGRGPGAPGGGEAT